MTGGDVVLLCWMRLLRRAHHIKTHFFFPAGKRNGFWNPKKKGLLRIEARCGVRRRLASLRPHGGPAPAVTAYAGGTGKGGYSISPPPGRWVSRRGLARKSGAPREPSAAGRVVERTSKGAERVFAVRRKQSEADFARTMSRPTNSVVPYRCGGRPQAAPTKTEKRSGRGGLWPPARSGVTFPSVILSEAKNPQPPSLCVTGRERDGSYGFFGLTASE